MERFYVRYEPRITLEIYNKFVEWVLKNKDPKWQHRGWVADSYENFVSEKYYLFGSNSLHYGVDNNSQGLVNSQLSFEELCALIDIKSQKENMISKTRLISIGDTQREITLTVLVKDGKVRAGYAVRYPEDEGNDDIAKTISKGRALSDRTNLLDMTITESMNQKYILYAIVDQLYKDIERGNIVIKGIK